MYNRLFSEEIFGSTNITFLKSHHSPLASCHTLKPGHVEALYRLFLADLDELDVLVDALH